MWKAPKQFCQRASCFICHYWKTENFPQLKVYHAHLATLPLSILLEEQAHARVQCLARTSVKQFRSLQSRRNITNAGANQWPLWENRSLQSFHPCQIRSMKSVSFAMLKAEKAWAWQTPQTLCWEDSLVADAAVLRLPGILSLPGIMLPVPVQGKNEQSIEQLLLCRKNTSTCAIHGKNEQGIEQLLLCRKNTSTCASSMSCQSCQLMWPSCSNPVHIDHQYWRKGRHAGVSQWPLWENHSLPSCHFCKGSADQWTVSTFPMLNSEKAWAWQTPQTLCLEELVADAAVWQASRNPIATSPTSDQESRCLFRFENEPSIEQLLPCWKNKHLC